IFEAAEPRRAKEHHGILDLLTTETRQRFDVFRHYSEDPAVGAIEEFGILIRHWRDFLFGRNTHRLLCLACERLVVSSGKNNFCDLEESLEGVRIATHCRGF